MPATAIAIVTDPANPCSVCDGVREVLAVLVGCDEHDDARVRLCLECAVNLVGEIDAAESNAEGL